MCVPGLAVSGIVGGLVVGSRPLVGLDGHLLSHRRDAAGKVLLAWLCALAPMLAFAAIGLLGSVIFGRSPIGLLLPAFGGAGHAAGAQVLPMPAAVRVALPSYALPLLERPVHQPAAARPAADLGIAVSLAWAVTATALAYLIFVRRDFTSMRERRLGAARDHLGVLPLAALFGALGRGGGLRRPGPRAPGSTGQAAAVARHGVRPPVRGAEPGAAPA